MAPGQSGTSPTVPALPALANPARIITTTDPENAKSTIDRTFDEDLPVTKDLGGALFRLAYVSGRAPEALDGNDVSTYGEYLKHMPALVVPGGGATVWYIDTPPGAGSPLHRTVSLDFVVVVEGEVQMKLDSGETRLLRVGDLVVQRGTTHQWTNPSKDRWSRMVGVMSESQPIALNDGTTLGVAGLG
ncbi:cupin domain protein [Xylaria arbuscula]|nr:cupin domain protein [Xylaria arbuscula]